MGSNDRGRVTASLFKDERATFERIEKFISPHHFIDYNLRGRLYGGSAPVALIHVDCGQERLPFADAKAKLDTDGKAVAVGFVLGPAWSTHWFKVSFEVPDTWQDKEICLQWDSGSEAMVWTVDGSPIQGLSSNFNRTDVQLDDSLRNGQSLLVEVAANELFGAGNNGMIQPPDPNKTFPLNKAHIAVFNRHVYEVLMDFDILMGMAKLLPTTNQRHYEALYLGNHMINAIVADDFSQAALIEAHKMATSFFNEKNGDSQLTIYAMGNCHIDTAWLWTYDETKRKCARSWSSTLRLMDSYPKLNFAISQAQQIVWLRENYPQLYERVIEKAKEGRFFGVGGSWVEMDGNLPSGESFVRQLLYGQREFQQVFGRASDTFWLPDTFGYSAQLPQIMEAAGMTRFVTQKMSWSLINKFPHSSFWWEGIDGTKVTVQECLETAENFRDKGRNNGAMMLYGHGDGGGGPTADILERLDRLANCDGIPKIVTATPTQFFDQLEKDGDSLCLWSGELFLELHNATYTTQADVKKMNRMCEFLLREQEFVQAIRFAQTGEFRSMEAEWKLVLLNQFHDVLPGTSIADVYFDAKNIYRRVNASLLTAPDTLRSFINQPESVDDQRRLVNSLSWERTIELNGEFYRLAPSSIQSLEASKIQPDDQAGACQFGDYIVLENKYLRAQIDKIGRVVSLRFRTASGEYEKFDCVAQDKCLNQFVIFDDVPLYWDAWDTMDYHVETRRAIDISAVNEAGQTSATITSSGPTIAEVAFALRISDTSSLRQTIRLKADCPYLEFDTYVDWNEKHKFLKVEFAVGVRAAEAWYDIQFGHVKRPTHRNTSWDAAKYEVCGHKWTALTEFDHGVAVLNDCKYGHSCHENVMTMSLLRAAKAPDEHADIGKHEFAYAVFPFTGTLQRPTNTKLNVIRAAYEFNMPPRIIDSWTSDVLEFVRVNGADGVIVEAVKVAESGEALVVRLFEAFGGRATATLRPNVPVAKAFICDGLETPREQLNLDTDHSFTLSFTPFQIQSVLLFLTN